MKTVTSFANIKGQDRELCASLIKELAEKFEKKYASRFSEDLVRLEARVSAIRKGQIFRVSLRLQLPSRVLATQEEGREVAEVIRSAFAELEKQAERYLSRLRREDSWKRPARRARIDEYLKPAKDEVERTRRELFFDIIEEHMDKLYNHIRRELTYLEASGAVPAGQLTVSGLVGATVLKALEEFEKRPENFSVEDWLLKIAAETIEEEARAARRAIPADVASLERRPEAPAEEPTESDAEMYEFYQPDEVLHLEDLVPDEDSEDPEKLAEIHDLRVALHRAMADLPSLWRRVLVHLDIDEMPREKVAGILGISEAEVDRIAKAAHEFLRHRLSEMPRLETGGQADVAMELSKTAFLPVPTIELERLIVAIGVATDDYEFAN